MENEIFYDATMDGLIVFTSPKNEPFYGRLAIAQFRWTTTKTGPYFIPDPFSFFSFEVIEVQHPPVRVNLVLNCLFQSFKRSSPQIRTT